MKFSNGTIVNRNTHHTESFSMSLLSIKDIDRVMALQEAVYAALPNKDVLAIDSQQFVEDSLRNDGFVIGVHNHKDRLVAYRFIALPKSQPDNMGLDIHLPKSDLHRVAHLETTLVHPDYRGNGLQSKTLQQAFPLLREKKIKHLICTVSPFNFFSLSNIMKNGLKIKVLTRKYGKLDDHSDGLWRFILHRDLEARPLIERAKRIHVNLDAFKIQEILLANGFVGDSLSHDGLTLSFVK